MDNTTSLSFLTKGSQVEVTSNEDGFSGAWYAATVIHPPPSISSQNHRTRNNLVYVEYHDLLSEDGSSNRLREYANISYVRPAPVSDSNPPDFQLNDLVDAFYRDGWWTGVITTVVDDSNFVVTFRNPPDEIQFSCSELRVHKKWVGGKWVQQQKQVTAGWMFTVGKKVEVSFESESLHGVWFPATVLKNSGNSTFLVEYQQPGAGDEAILHKVTVDYNHIRPSPPHLRDKNFVLLEKVDAYYDFGWWCGVITKELADNRYNVYFKHTKKQREFICSRVRPHMEWKGGKWFNISQGNTAVRTTHSFVDDQIEQATPIIGKQSPVETSTMKRKLQKNLVSNEKTSPNDEAMNDDSSKEKENLSEKTSPNDEAMNDDSSKEKENLSEKISPNDEAMNDDSSERNEDPSVGQSEDSEVSGMTDQAFSKTENLSHGKKVHSKQGKITELKTPTTDSSKKRGRLTNELKSLQALTNGSEVDLVKRRTKEIVEKKDATEDFIFVVMGLPCHRMTVSQGNLVQKLPDEKAPDVAKSDTEQPGVPSAPLTVVDQEGSEGDSASVAFKRKRGRPPKAPITVNHEIGSVVTSTLSVVEADQRKEVDLTTSSGTKSLEENQGPVNEQPGLSGKQNEPLIQDNLPNESTEEDLHVQLDGKPKKYSARKSKWPKPRTISINAESPAQVSGVHPQDASKEKADGSLEKNLITEPSVGKSLDTVPDDQPISRLFEGTQHSPMDGPVSGVDLQDASKGNADESLEKDLTTEPSVGKSLDTVPGDQPISRLSEGKHSPMDGPEGTVEQSSTASEGWLDSLNLPFIRSKALWKTLESMEAFRMLPQKPHFRPLLEGVREGAREGLAIGSMVTFSTMFDKTCSLRFDDPRSTIEDCLETLVELENNGFDVVVMRERLTELLLIKDKHDELEKQSKGDVEKIEEHNVRAKGIEEEIEETNRQIRELEERMKQALLMKEKRIAEISAMEATMKGIEQEIREVGAEFVGLATAPFVV